jgi:dCMP deaminase
MEVINNRARPSWDDYFMTIALAAASRASCIKIHSGAVIVNKNRVISTGYNGYPKGIKSCFDNGFCGKEVKGVNWDEKNTGNCFAVHAEVNAIIYAHRKDMESSILYSVLYPCADCAKTIVGAGIKEVVYLRYYKEKASQTKEIFEKANVIVRKLDFDYEKIFDLLKFIATDNFA